uniref:Uncharacterized protein n=1 Tax=Timema cristinae TaxID=61476 RepID=A0A7R9CCV4_TIMCR|nr:unnamed protein product [Timema cristinae]
MSRVGSLPHLLVVGSKGSSCQERPLTQLTRAPCTVTPLPQVPAPKFDRLEASATKLKPFSPRFLHFQKGSKPGPRSLNQFSPRFLYLWKGWKPEQRSLNRLVQGSSTSRKVGDIPTQVPPLTPGTNKKMTEALKASFASWEKEQLRLNIVKGYEEGGSGYVFVTRKSRTTSGINLPTSDIVMLTEVLCFTHC